MLTNVGWWARNLRSVGSPLDGHVFGLVLTRFLYKSTVFWFDGWAGLAGLGCWLGWAGLVARLLLVAIGKGKVSIACNQGW